MEQFLATNLFSIIQLVFLLAGGVWAISSMKTVQEIQSERLKAVENELSELRKVVISIARQEERLSSVDQRISAQGDRLDLQGDRITTMATYISQMRSTVDDMIKRN